MTYRLLNCNAFIFVIPSCTHGFSLNEVDAKIVLFCILLGDTTLIRVARSRVIHNRGTEAQTANKHPCWVERRKKFTNGSFYQFPRSYTVGKLKEDDLISIGRNLSDAPVAKSREQ